LATPRAITPKYLFFWIQSLAHVEFRNNALQRTWETNRIGTRYAPHLQIYSPKSDVWQS
jgi:hypothetical protein